jgi:hypothetical protein
MSKGSRPQPIAPGESRQARLSLAVEALAILDAEAERLQLDAPGFVRLLLRRAKGRQLVQRAPEAPPVAPLTARKPAKEPFVVLLNAELFGFLHELCNRLGDGSPSTVVSHLVLDWAGISPLARSAIVPVERGPSERVAGSARRRTGSQPTRVQLLSLAEPVVARLEAEAAWMGIRHTELLRHLLRAKMGVAAFERAAGAPARARLDDVHHPKVKLTVHLPRDQVELIEELSARLGGGEKSTIVSHLVLDYLGISPLEGAPAREVV